MSEEPIDEEVPRSPWRRRGIIALLVIGALVFAASRIFYAVPGLNLLSERGRHDRMLSRITHQMELTMTAVRGNRPMDPSDWPPSDDRARYYLLSAMKKALWNVMPRPEDLGPGKLRAIHARLDANEYEEFLTLKGCWEVFALFEEAAPKFLAYGPVREIYELQAQGAIPAAKR